MALNSKRKDYSLLIISSSEQFNIAIKKILPGGTFSAIETRKSASAAKRELLERHYDVIIINAPLPDEFGVDFVMDIQDRHNSGILVAVPGEVFDTVTDRTIDYGVIVVPKPVKLAMVERGVRLLIAVQNRLRSNEKKIKSLEDKITEIRFVARAKLMLIQNGMNEEEAERYIIKQAMDGGVRKSVVAEEIIENGGIKS
ncbi:MAG: ANTAR domain-containing protein [Eubacterium sp.]|nr:ANTAR domain-containing protein [Eubacterium sp.]HBE09071.1 antitermination regulator [Lachnospiraceae bacterium]